MSSSQAQSHQIYLAYIDGLRALAILAVVIYHALPSALPGGFVGVDIFFVISGFLISSIIFRALASGHFSLVDFYARRIRRIFPALILVLATFLGVGWYFLLSDELRQLGKHTAAGAGFFQNISLWKEAGYFDVSSELKPLMHLWSLAIEEQYYLFCPLLLTILWRYRRASFLILFLLALISFAWNVANIHHDPIAVFFLPQTRIWELLVGGLLAYMHIFSKRPYSYLTDIFAYTGLLLILISVFVIDKTRAFPGWWALLPVSGSLLLIHAGPHAWINKNLLSQRWLVSIGLVSYPWYLWHWPLLSFGYIVEGSALSNEARVIIVLGSFLLACVTYIVIEKPLRSTPTSKTRTLVLTTLMISIGLLGYATYMMYGFNLRDNEKNKLDLYFSNYQKTHNIEKIFRMECGFYNWEKTDELRKVIAPGCYNPHSEKRIFLWGDSHAQHLNSGLNKILPTSISILQIATSWCIANVPGMDDGYVESDMCRTSNAYAIEKIKATKPQIVIIAEVWGHDTRDYELISKQLREYGVKHVFLLGPAPQWNPYLYKVLLKRYWPDIPRRLSSNLIKEVFTLDKKLKEKYSKSVYLQYISVVDYLCNADGCITYFGDDAVEGIQTPDYGHFTPVASEFFAKDILAPLILKTFTSS